MMEENEYTKLKLAKMVSEDMSKETGEELIECFLKFMTSQTGEMLFDKNYDLWMDGPDYIYDEYKQEMYFKKYGKPMPLELLSKENS